MVLNFFRKLMKPKEHFIQIYGRVAIGECDYGKHFVGIREYLGEDAGECEGKALYCLGRSEEEHWHLCIKHTMMLVGKKGVHDFETNWMKQLHG